MNKGENLSAAGKRRQRSKWRMPRKASNDMYGVAWLCFGSPYARTMLEQRSLGYRSSSGCTDLYGEISCVAVSLIM
jgi:hypothetical protein